MKYLLLVYLDERKWGTLSAGEREACETASRASEGALRESGYLLAALEFQENDSAIRVRVQDGQFSLEEGLVGEAGERLTGLFLIQARDLNEAIRLAAGMPGARCGAIEVRSIHAKIRT